ncbi:treslin-like [Mya arenaria]|uniref:treslin-like n=1 Tax=Mya arenaria TaxID=6604 RepID=UPI0022DEE997|nr:treslin-like [Mya arenaria]
MRNQIVFLIDTDIDECFGNSITKLSNSICLTCLRLLHFLSSQNEKKGTVKKSKLQHTPIKWSYKFFNSKTCATKLESHKLYDLKLKYFEEFENEVQRRYESSGTGKVQSSAIKPSDSIHLALMQLLADFQWESPDLTSPLKGRKNKKEAQLSYKYAVLFTRCPKTASELKRFTGKQVPDADVFLDTLLPGSLYEQFCKVNKISLYFVDTHHKNHINEGDLRSVCIIEDAISKAGGNVLPLDAIVQHGSYNFCSISMLLDDCEKDEEEEVAQLMQTSETSCVSLLPTTSLLSSWINSGQNKNLVTQTSNIVLIDTGNTVIQTVTSSIERRDSVQTDHRATDLSEVDTLLAETISNFNSSNTFKVYGLLEHQIAGLFPHQGISMCLTAAPTPSQARAQPTTDGKLEAIIHQLAIRQCSLVLVSPESGQLAVLEPLTVQTACLSLVPQGSALALEKQLLSQRLAVVSPDIEPHETSDSLIQRLVSKVPKIISAPVESLPETGRFDGRLLDRWQVPGPSKPLQSLINKLNQRLSGLDFLSTEEAGVLKQLQKQYKLEKRPPAMRETPVPADNDSTQTDVDKFELPYKGKASRASLSRAEMILSKSKAVVKGRDQERAEMEAERRDKHERKPQQGPCPLADFSSVEELQTYLTSMCERVSSAESSTIDSTVQTLVTVTLHYFKQNEPDNAEAKCRSLLEKSLLQSGTQLREKYSANNELSQQQKLAEYSVQVMLRMEMMSTLEGQDQQEGEEEANEEVVGLLRTLSFMSGPGFLNKFMETNLVSNYVHSLPQTLANIYDELMQPLPETLAEVLSPGASSGEDRSILDASLVSVEGEISGPPSTRLRSQGSVGPPSSQPGSNRSGNFDVSAFRNRGGRKLVHHPSLADFGAKRQIVVEKMPKQNHEKSSKSAKRQKDANKRSRDKGTPGANRSRDKVSKALFDKPKGSTKLERRQSVAVMQITCKTPKKTPKKTPRKGLKSPRYHQSPRRKLVAETPNHKQVSSVSLRAGGRQRHGSSTTVVEESPEKACETTLRDTPTKKKRAKALLRRSFYSAGPVKRTKNLSQYFQLADKIAGRQRQKSGPQSLATNKLSKLLSFDSSVEFKSPDKNSSFLLSQLVASPSPAKATPRKVLTATPSKLLLESPARNTRSRGASPVVNLFKSPSTRTRHSSPEGRSELSNPEWKQRIANSATNHLRSPRRQSPRVLVPDSDTKAVSKSPQSTPVKSPACGVIMFGLDSPSQNTRQKSSQTPTRHSVRAALFSRSPAVNRTQSPHRSAASPRVLFDKTESPTKIASCNISCLQKGFESQNLFNVVKKGSENLISSGNKNNKSMNLQKTPSPKVKKITKTPDSFDKWHRRKPRSTQCSPAVQKSKPVSMTVLSQQDHGKNILSETISQKEIKHETRKKRALIDSPSKLIPSPSKNLKGCENIEPSLEVITRNKRSLMMSPGKSTESPSKRRRLTTDVQRLIRNDTLDSLGRGSQGFDTCENNLSQVSNTSMDYFSASNDEVFLSQSSSAGLSPNKKISAKSYDNNRSTRLFSKNSSLLSASQGMPSPRNKELQRLFSEGTLYSDVSDNERSESPIFSVRSRNKSGGKALVSHDSDGFNTNDIVCSPKKVNMSPGAKKYSPNVSAKSLMHLIQSPLLRSGGGEKDKANGSGNKGNVAFKSRRSLKLNN